MADKEVGGLTAATTLDGSELLHVVQGSNSRKTTVSDILGTAHSQAWSGVTGTPSTVSGYGITDAQAKSANLTAIAALSPTSKSVIIGNGSAWTAESGATFRTSVGLAIGADVQAYDADLTALGGLAKTDGNVIIGNGTTWTVESGATLRTSFGLSIGTDVQAYNATLASLAGLTLTDGDLLYSTGASALANLARGADGQVLRLSGGMPSWASVTGTGDMAAAIYDPNSIGGDAFSQDNMVDGTTNKNFTAAEKTKLAGAGDMLAANDLSELASADTALTNLGAGAAGKVIFADTDGQATLDQIIDRDFTADGTGAVGLPLGDLLQREVTASMFGAKKTNTQAQNRTALDAAIAAVDAAGGGVVRISENYGYKYDIAYHPDLSACVNDVVVIDTSPGNSYTSPAHDGMQIREFYKTYEGNPDAYGSHDGNGRRIMGPWNPYLFLTNTANYAAPNDPSRRSDDNRRTMVLFGNKNIANWTLGQGGLAGAGYTDDQMSGFVLSVLDVPLLGIEQSKVLEISKVDLTTLWSTGPWRNLFRSGLAASTILQTPDDREVIIQLVSATNNCAVKTSSGVQSSGAPSFLFLVNGSYRWQFMGDGRLLPTTDNTTAIGAGSLRISTLFAGTGTINTSDEREKMNAIDATEDEAAIRAIRKVKFKRFQWADAIAKKGEAVARLHFGVIAQQVKEAFESEGLDAFRYGLLCYDEWDDMPAHYDEDGKEVGAAVAAGNRYGVRMDQVLSLKLAALDAA